jgi:hypothetical protein
MRANNPLLHSDITASIVDSFFAVHKDLGFGFREYVYSRARCSGSWSQKGTSRSMRAIVKSRLRPC